MSAGDVFLLFSPLAGVLLIGVFVYWQNERDAALHRKKK
ncbi:Hypothetical protein NGAL_HAMBI2566_42710 [Neorhizobium galegae bv. orientalis]|nr:Hypothetical protein NGAL_HAMBI2566_42710 [Neorhizobium galegae bv. orientalis]